MTNDRQMGPRERLACLLCMLLVIATAGVILAARVEAASCPATYQQWNIPNVPLGDEELRPAGTLKLRLYWSDCGTANEVYTGMRGGLYPKAGSRFDCDDVGTTTWNLGSIGTRNPPPLKVPCAAAGTSRYQAVVPVRLTSSSDRCSASLVDVVMHREIDTHVRTSSVCVPK